MRHAAVVLGPLVAVGDLRHRRALGPTLRAVEYCLVQLLDRDVGPLVVDVVDVEPFDGRNLILDLVLRRRQFLLLVAWRKVDPVFAV